MSRAKLSAIFLVNCTQKSLCVNFELHESEQCDYISDRAKMYAEIPETKVLIKNYEVD